MDLFVNAGYGPPITNQLVSYKTCSVLISTKLCFLLQMVYYL